MLNRQKLLINFTALIRSLLLTQISTVTIRSDSQKKNQMTLTLIKNYFDIKYAAAQIKHHEILLYSVNHFTLDHYISTVMEVLLTSAGMK